MRYAFLLRVNLAVMQENLFLGIFYEWKPADRNLVFLSYVLCGITPFYIQLRKLRLFILCNSAVPFVAVALHLQ